MNLNELTYLLQKPSAITLEQTNQLETLLEEFPYFQAARAVRLKGLHNNSSFLYNNELKKTAAHTTDRTVLFDFITSEEFTQNEVSKQIKKQEHYINNITVFEAEEVKVGRQVDFDDAIKMNLQDAEKVLNPDLFELPKKEAVPEKPEEEVKETASEELEIGKPLSFNKSEAHSFSEWLKLTKVKPIERTENEDSDNEEKNRKFELINDFIAKSPKIVPSKNVQKTNLAKERTTAPEALMTETLARVYLEQKNYKKAIQAYKILILKNPEKSGFFADQIRAIQKLQDNN